MTSATVKNMLDSLVPAKNERDFQFVFSGRNARYRKGMYSIKEKEIVLYPKAFQGYPKTHMAQMNLIGTALHELAHHLAAVRNGRVYTHRLHKENHMTPHGKEFKKILDELIGACNSGRQKTAKGILAYDRRKPTKPPRFVPIERNRKKASSQ